MTVVPRVEPPVATRGRPLRSLNFLPALGMSQLYLVGVLENVRLRMRRRCTGLGAGIVNGRSQMEQDLEVPVRSDNELNWAMSPLDIRGGGMLVYELLRVGWTCS